MTDTKETAGSRNPNVWVPTLYFTQGFPYTTVMEMATVFFKALNVPIEALGIFQGFFGLPWAFKFLWSPLVELIGTKRRWILAVQGLLAATLVVLAIFISMPQHNALISLRLFMINFASNWANAGFTVGLLLLMFCAGFGMDSRRSGAFRAACAAVGIAVLVFFVSYNSQIFTAQTLTLSTTIWVAFIIFLLIAFLSATQDIAIDGYYLDVLDVNAQAAFSGIRVMFYRVAMVAGSGVLVMVAGKTSWTLGFGIGAAVFSALYLFHLAYLPSSARTGRETGSDGQKKSFTRAFTTYLDQKRIIVIILFILLFRIGDFLWKPMSKPFLMDIGISVSQIGFLQGVLGIIATILGSIAGGIYIAKRGLTRGLWVLGIIQSITLLLYAWLALVHKIVPKGPDGLPLGHIPHTVLIHVGVINTFENFAYGLGTIAFVNFLMRTCKKEYTAAHYAIATGLMALATMLAAFFSGFLAKQMGYMTFFIFCFLTSIPGLAILYFLPLKDMEAAK